MKLISIVMPIYDPDLNYLKISIESILNQTYTNIELLLICDPCCEIKDILLSNFLKQYDNDKRIRILFHKRKTGLVDSLNEGIRISKGDYIARMDADDISNIKRLELQYYYLNNQGLDAVGSWAYIINENGDRINKIIVPSKNLIQRYLLLHNTFLHGSMLIKKSILKIPFIYNKNYLGAEDYYLWLNLISHGYKLDNYPSFLLFLRENPNSITRGSKWIDARKKYLAVKYYAFRRLGYNRPLDFIFLFLTHFNFIIYPSYALFIKDKLNNLFNKVY